MSTFPEGSCKNWAAIWKSDEWTSAGGLEKQTRTCDSSFLPLGPSAGSQTWDQRHKVCSRTGTLKPQISGSKSEKREGKKGCQRTRNYLGRPRRGQGLGKRHRRVVCEPLGSASSGTCGGITLNGIRRAWEWNRQTTAQFPDWLPGGRHLEISELATKPLKTERTLEPQLVEGRSQLAAWT